jgi:diguanylate cyclase (GGDEF)-like protein/putative nucleotidyltransferase with HDIG domain
VDTVPSARHSSDTLNMARKLAKLRRTFITRMRWSAHHGVASEISDPALMARSGAYLFGSGASLACVWLFLPNAGHVDQGAMLSMVALSYAMVALLIFGYDRIPRWGFQAFLLGFTLLVSGLIFYSGKGASPYSFFYVWAALYALYFFSAAEAAAHVVFMGVCYAAVLVAHHMTGSKVSDLAVAVEESAAQWTIAFGTLVVATALFGLLKERLDSLIDRLTDAVSTDALTGLLNRRGLEEAFEMEVERARRNEAKLTLLVGDLDHFKQLNDRLGHPAGDRALELLGECLTAGVRRIDRVGRMGGEEFALVLPDTEEHQGYVLAERLRSKVRENFAADIFPLTISFGLATYPKHGTTTAALLKAADQALYTAKEFGRDCSVIYSAETADILQGQHQHRKESTVERRVSSLIGLAGSMDTAEHSQMVGRYTKLIAIELGLPTELVERVQLAGILHDIGKIGVADSIVNKPGSLTPEEWAEMEKHPEFGARMLERAELWDIAEWVLAHHERPDGKGYPLGLEGEQIPLEARIVAVADAYEAMTTDRVYRSSIGHTAARAELRRGAGTQFDARVVEAFLKAHEPNEDPQPRRDIRAVAA